MVLNGVFSSEGGKFVYNHLIWCFIANHCISTMANGLAPTPNALDESAIAQSTPSRDLPDSPVPPAPAPPPPETGRSKAVTVAGVTVFHLHLVLSRISGRMFTAMSRFVQDVQNHYDLPAASLLASNRWECTQTNWELGWREKPKLCQVHNLRITILLPNMTVLWPAWSTAGWTVCYCGQCKCTPA